MNKKTVKLIQNIWLALVALSVGLFFIGVVTESKVIGNIVTVLFIIVMGSFATNAIIRLLQECLKWLKEKFK
jgi:hypothetical protein